MNEKDANCLGAPSGVTPLPRPSLSRPLSRWQPLAGPCLARPYVLPLSEASAAVRTAAGALCAGRRRRSATSTHGVATAACKPTGANWVAAAALGPAQRLASRGGWRGEQSRRPRERWRRGARLQRRVPARLCRLGRQRCEQQGEPPCSSRPRSEQLCPSSAGGRGPPRRAARGEAAAAAARAAIRAEGSGGACAGSGPQRTLRPRLSGPRAGAVAVRALFLTTYWIGSWVVDGTSYIA